MKRLIILVYGLIAYIAFFGVFLYLVGFLGDFAVPKSVSSGPSASPLRAFLIDLGLISLFALQHLIMARQSFKRWWTRVIPEPMERSTFVLAANLCLVVLFFFWQPIPAIVWEIEGQILPWVFHASLLLGCLLVVYSSFLIDHFDLLGLRQVYCYFRNEPYVPVPFKVSSLYKEIRHPMMLGILMVLWSTPVMTVGHFILSTGFSAFIFIGVWFEERDLMRDFGQAYAAYRQRTRMLVPSLRRKTASMPQTGGSAAEAPYRCSKEPC